MAVEVFIVTFRLVAFLCISVIIIAILCWKRKRSIRQAYGEEESTPAKRQAYGEEESTPAKRRRTDQPKGIPNRGNTCYMNSVLQCLAWSPCLQSQLESQVIEQNKSSRGREGLAIALLSVLETYHHEPDASDDENCGCCGCSRRKKNTMQDHVRYFLRVISKQNHQYLDGQQEDSFEFFNVIMSSLEDEALTYFPHHINGEESRDEHIMRHCGAMRLCGGKFLTSYCYKECGHVDTAFQRFTSLSISVNKKNDVRSESCVLLTEDETASMRVNIQSGNVYTVKPVNRGGSMDTHLPQSDMKASISCSSDHDLLGGLTFGVGNGRRTQTGVELGLEMLTTIEEFNASELCCRICKAEGKTGNEGVVYKRLQIISLPPILVLHINRFEQRGSQMYKVDHCVSYPKVLDMSSYCSTAMEVIPKANAMLASRRMYSLFAVINHYGTIRGGHYDVYIKTGHRNVEKIQNQVKNNIWKDPESLASAIRKQQEEIWREERSLYPALRKEQEDSSAERYPDTWFHVSDSRVKEEDEATVLKSSAAYILMYERI